MHRVHGSLLKDAFEYDGQLLNEGLIPATLKNSLGNTDKITITKSVCLWWPVRNPDVWDIGASDVVAGNTLSLPVWTQPMALRLGKWADLIKQFDQTVLNHICFGLDNKHIGHNKHIEPRFIIILTASWYPPCRTEFLASSHMSQLDNFHTWQFWIITDFGIIKFFWII